MGKVNWVYLIVSAVMTAVAAWLAIREGVYEGAAAAIVGAVSALAVQLTRDDDGDGRPNIVDRDARPDGKLPPLR